MKRVFITLAFLAVSLYSFGQSNTSPWPNTGNVGIGTNAPLAIEHLQGTSAGGVLKSLIVENRGTSNGSGTAIYMGYQNTSTNPYGIRLVQKGAPVSNRLGSFEIQQHNSSGGDGDADWTTALAVATSGNVGIGTTSPDVKFHVLNTTEQLRLGYDASNYASFATNSGGSLVITPTSGGVSFHASVSNLLSNSATSTSPHGNSATLLQLANTDATSGNTAGLKFMDGLGVVYSAIENIYTTRTSGAEDAMLTFTTIGSGSRAERMRITPNGSVVIGTLDPHGFKLAVNGNAIATSMTVQLNANWPDYVFDPGYQLPGLKDVKSYIDRNGHLPDMPSAHDIDQNGLNLGEINTLLTKKVEELTLYLIEQQKTNQELQQQITDIKKLLQKPIE